MALMVIIKQAEFPADADAVLDIWREFVASPSVDLSFQGNEDEFANLPGKYAPPGGCILLGWRGARVIGCIAFRKVDASICEMKRLYVRPEARGLGLGRTLAEALIEETKRSGYTEMRLDVLEEFTIAQVLYRELGFTPAEPISFNPLPGTQFLGLRLG